MNNLQQSNNSDKKLADKIAALVENGIDDNTLLEVATAMWLEAVNPDNPDAVYENYPTLTQFVTEEHSRLGKSEEMASLIRRFDWKDQNMYL
ncbi:MAG TPA: hypothetical protein VF721_15150 [Pyrinomonadaceae bacterium]